MLRHKHSYYQTALYQMVKWSDQLTMPGYEMFWGKCFYLQYDLFYK